jgi:GT2 family glycosyltransferase
VTGPVCSVVIPSYNGRKLLEVCLESIARCKPREIEVEVIVVDDASTDDTRAWIASVHPEVRLVALPRNLGFVGASNAGIEAATGEFIQLLNNDTEVTPGWIEAGLALFADKRVGSVAPLVLVRSDPSRVDSAGDSYSFVGWPFKRGHGRPVSEWTEHPDDEVLGASGSSAFYRAQPLREVGAYDPAFGSYYEDVDLAFRLRWAGFICVYAPKCRILHEVSASYDHGKPALQRRMSRNAELLFWSNLPLRVLIVAALPHMVFIMVQGLWRLARGRVKPFLLGKWDALVLSPMFLARRRFRYDLSRKANSSCKFPLSFSTLRDAQNHLRRPKESYAGLSR